jgi:bacterioferritin-associated ferredoxin
MIVCLCRGVNDRTIRSVIERGAETVDDVTDACGAGGGCGQCRNAVACLIENYAPKNHGLISLEASRTASATAPSPGASLAGSQGNHRAA